MISNEDSIGDLVAFRTKIYRRYHKQGGNAWNCRCKVDKVVKGRNCSTEHEDAKEEVCRILTEEGKKFITEAIDNRTNLRRDIVCLDNAMIYEVETDKRRAERFKCDKSVIVIELWKKTKFDALVRDTCKKTSADFAR